MNPITENRAFFWRYVALYILFTVAWVLAFGSIVRVGVGYAVIDGAVVLVVSGIEGLLLWNILKYGSEGISGAPLRVAFYFVVGMLFVGVTVAAESAVMSVLPREDFRLFSQTIPARAFCLVMVYVLFALYYSHAVRLDDERVAIMPASAPGASSSGMLERITVRAGQRIKVIEVSEIIYLQAEGDYVAIVTAEGRRLKEQTMKYFEENLPRTRFVRVHRSFIVSVSHISRIEQSGREHSVVLRDGSANGTVIRISDAGYKLLRATLGL